MRCTWVQLEGEWVARGSSGDRKAPPFLSCSFQDMQRGSCIEGPSQRPQGGDPGVYLLPTEEPAAAPVGRVGSQRGSQRSKEPWPPPPCRGAGQGLEVVRGGNPEPSLCRDWDACHHCPDREGLLLAPFADGETESYPIHDLSYQGTCW